MPVKVEKFGNTINPDFDCVGTSNKKIMQAENCRVWILRIKNITLITGRPKLAKQLCTKN